MAVLDELVPQVVYEWVMLKQSQLETLPMIAGLQRQTGQTAEALGSRRRAESIATELVRNKPDEVKRLVSWGIALATLAGLEREVNGTVSPETRAALDEVGQRLDRPTLTDAGELYNLACLYSVLSGLGPLDKTLPADQARQRQAAAADRAMAALRRAVAAGWNDVEQMKHDPNLDPLRARPDFQALLLDLSFPADPFAHRLALEP
jgi:hypothetical protein